MNEKTLIEKPPYNFKRIWAKVCMTLAQLALMPPSIRYKMLKMGEDKPKRAIIYRIQCAF